MASPNDSKQNDHLSDLSGADQAFLDAMNQGGTGFSGMAQNTMLDKAIKVKTIRSRFMTTVLPIMIIPLVLLGFLAIAGLTLLGSQTTDAVATTDDILEEHNLTVSQTMETSSDAGVDAVDELLVGWYSAVTSIESSDADASEVATGFEGFSAFGNASTQTGVQVLFVDSAGRVLSSSHPETTLSTYAGAEWIELAEESDRFRSFVNDAEHEPSFEFSVELDDGNFARVRVPFTNLQDLSLIHI